MTVSVDEVFIFYFFILHKFLQYCNLREKKLEFKENPQRISKPKIYANRFQSWCWTVVQKMKSSHSGDISSKRIKQFDWHRERRAKIQKPDC